MENGVGITANRLLALDGHLWHSQVPVEAAPLNVSEQQVTTDINALLPMHDRQRMPLYPKQFNAALDEALRKELGLDPALDTL